VSATESGKGAWRSLVADPKHGPFPVILLVMTVTTGVVDAVSILSLGRVFVANMTGNIVFVGFALAGAHGFSLSASLAALAGFLLGALGYGKALSLRSRKRSVELRNAVVCEVVLIAVAFALAEAAGNPIGGGTADAMAALMATALGIQNGVVRHLAVPDLTTTVLTMTLTGIAADRQADRSVVSRRLLAVLAMLGGAVAGALLDLHLGPSAAMALAVGLFALVLSTIVVVMRVDPSGRWQE
jgi:uncharacterized membrane protein YoaK (UPF0700 family)